MLLSTGEMAAAAKIRRLEEMTLVAKAGKSKEVAQDRDRRLPRAVYERELFRLQAELVMLQEWVRAEGARVVVVFEGRDAAGKGSAIKRVTEYLNPACRTHRRAARAH
jgi:polyphosphate kinase 2 (PPK2 family)